MGIYYSITFDCISDCEDFATMAAKYLASRRYGRHRVESTAKPRANTKGAPVALDAEAVARALLALTQRR